MPNSMSRVTARKALVLIALVTIATSSCSPPSDREGSEHYPTPTTTRPALNEVELLESTGSSVKAQLAPAGDDAKDTHHEISTGVVGVEVLYMGHSFGRPFAENMENAAELAGIDGHSQLIVSRGGERGAPQAMWENPNVQVEIKEKLDTGTVDILVMICCSQDLLASGVTNSWAELEIAEYALAQNPDTQIGLAMPWVDFPRNFNDAAEHRERTDEGFLAFHAFGEQLSADLGGADVFTFYHGAAIYELREMFELGELPEIESLIGPRATSIFTDEKGHAGLLAKDVGTLIWLNAIYGIDPLDVAMVDNYEVDIRQVASNALESTVVT